MGSGHLTKVLQLCKISEAASQFHESDMYAINRVDADRHGQNAWHVNFSRGCKTFQMTFNDGTYGGTEAACLASITYSPVNISKKLPGSPGLRCRLRVM